MGRQHSNTRTLAAGLMLSAVFALAGCGGGGGSDGTAAGGTAVTPVTLSGVVATGVALANATVTLTDATAATKTATADASGNYSFDVTGMTAPFVIKASGSVNGTSVSLVSVQDTAPASGTITVNVTPITNAIAAALSSSGDPQALDAKSDAANIKAKIADVKTFVAQTLAPTLAAAGVDTSKFDPVNSTFKADRTGLDKALDSIAINVAPDGTVSMSNKAAVGKIDDLAQTTSAPAASATANGSTVITFSKSDDFKAKAAAVVAGTAAKMDADVEDSSVADQAVAAFNACFKLAATQRPTDPACTGLVSSTYKNNGMSATQEFGGLLADTANDNAVFNKPEVIRFLFSDPTKPADRVVVQISWTRTDGTVGSITTVAKNFGANGGWKLDGNQRDYFLFTNAIINRYEAIVPASVTNPRFVSHYQSGLNLYVSSSIGKGTTIGWVKVTGPGLPAAGIVLRPSSGSCAYLTIVSKNGITGGTAAGAAGNNTCTSIFKMTGIALDGSTAADMQWGDTTDTTTVYGSAHTAYASPKVADSVLSAIKPLDAYTYQIHDASGSDTYIVDRLRSQPMTLAQVTSSVMGKRWYSFDAATKASLDPTSSGAFTGGAQFPMTWVRPDGAPPVYAVNVQFRPSSTGLVDSNPRVPLGSTSAKVNAPTGSAWPAATATSLGFQIAQVVGRTEDDMQVFYTLAYNNF